MIYVLIYSIIGILGILYYLSLIERDKYLNDTTLEDIALEMRDGENNTINYLASKEKI